MKQALVLSCASAAPGSARNADAAKASICRFMSSSSFGLPLLHQASSPHPLLHSAVRNEWLSQGSRCVHHRQPPVTRDQDEDDDGRQIGKRGEELRRDADAKRLGMKL